MSLYGTEEYLVITNMDVSPVLVMSVLAVGGTLWSEKRWCEKCTGFHLENLDLGLID